MFDSYKYLVGKKEQLEKKGLLDFLLRPYKILFKDSKEQPKEVGIKPEVESEKPEEKVEEVSKPKPQPIAPSNDRAGKVIWKKK